MTSADITDHSKSYNEGEKDTVSAQELALERLHITETFPTLDREDIAETRHSTGHHSCVQLLAEGYPECFQELFKLIKQGHIYYTADRKLGIQNIIPLEDDYEKIKVLAETLVEAEDAHRAGILEMECQIRLHLADEFYMLRINWLAEHFYNSCLTVLLNMEDPEEKKAEVLLKLGLLAERRDDLKTALNMMEDAYFLLLHVKCENVEQIDNVSLHIHRVCMAYAQKLLNASGQRKEEQALYLMRKGLYMAEQAKSNDAEALSHNHIGQLLFTLGAYDTAIQQFIHFLKVSEYMENHELMCQAYLAISKCYENKKDFKPAIHFADRCEQLSTENGLEKALASSCITLGQLYTLVEKFKEADVELARAYNILKDKLDDHDVKLMELEFTRLLCGKGKAHVLLPNLYDIFSDRGRNCLFKILSWRKEVKNVEL